MNTTIDFDRLARAWLDEGPTELSDFVLDTALEGVHMTRQRRALRAPWRFPDMPALSRATAVAAVALVAVVAAGAIYVNVNSPGDSGSSPTPTAAPTANTPGISGWKTYTSAAYGYTISYPDDWTVVARATRKWQPGDAEEAPSWDIFLNPEAVDGDSMVFQALQFPAPAGADLRSWDGLLAALEEMCAKPGEFFLNADRCPSGSVAEASTRMCLGSTGCQPVALVHERDLPRALFGDPVTGALTYVLVGRVDDFPAAARYGGTVMLLKSILSQLGVREPGPEETPN